MRRHRITPRSDWQDRARVLGFDFANIDDGSYWDESAAWEFGSADVDVLNKATIEINRLYRLAMDHAVRHDCASLLGVSPPAWRLVVASWRRQEPSLYGRFDLRWDGSSAPRLLEYNADTPTSLYEASVVQWDWLTQCYPDADQFNSLHEALIAQWGTFLMMSPTIHFTCMRNPIEDRATTEYLRDTALQAGLKAPFIAIEDIGWDGRQFRDLQRQTIGSAFKLYPWDWLLQDQFGAHIELAATRWIEPAWKLAASSKGMLALLWHMFPGHPNLLPAYREAGRTGGAEIRKPLFGREGANITAPGIETGGPYESGEFVYQAWCPLPCFDGRYPVFGSWIVGDRPHGIGIREDETPITRDTSSFVPHFFRQ